MSNALTQWHFFDSYVYLYVYINSKILHLSANVLFTVSAAMSAMYNDIQPS